MVEVGRYPEEEQADPGDGEVDPGLGELEGEVVGLDGGHGEEGVAGGDHLPLNL